MSNYDYNKVVQDFASRTKENLQFIEDNLDKPGIRVYEVTQLVNSLLGLLVFPQQEFLKRIPETPLSDLEAAGWPKIRNISNYKTVENLNTFVRYFRNAITHFNISFIADNDNNITGLRVWNHQQGKRSMPKNWEIELSLDEIKIITDRFVDLVVKE